MTYSAAESFASAKLKGEILILTIQQVLSKATY